MEEVTELEEEAIVVTEVEDMEEAIIQRFPRLPSASLNSFTLPHNIHVPVVEYTQAAIAFIFLAMILLFCFLATITLKRSKSERLALFLLFAIFLAHDDASPH